MTFVRKFVLALAIVSATFGTNSTAKAQNGGLDAGLNLLLAFPQGEFKQNYGKTAVGIAGHIGYAFGDLPFMIGGEFGFATYGSENFTAIWQPFGVKLTSQTNNNLALFNLLFRLQPNSGWFRPHLDALVGGKYFSTETSVKSDGQNSEKKEIASTTQQNDIAFSYGAGGGVQFRVFHAKPPKEGEIKEKQQELQDVFIDVQARYLLGTKAEYLTPGSIPRDTSGNVLVDANGNVKYNAKTSLTDFLTFQIGVTVRF